MLFFLDQDKLHSLKMIESSNFWLYAGDIFTISVWKQSANQDSCKELVKRIKSILMELGANINSNGGDELQLLARGCYEKAVQLNKKNYRYEINIYRNICGCILANRIITLSSSVLCNNSSELPSASLLPSSKFILYLQQMEIKLPNILQE